MKTLRITSDLSEVKKTRNFLSGILKELNLDEKDCFIIELSLLEICLNIIKYAYPDEKGEIFIKIWQEENKILLEIRDSGIPFDPRATESPVIDEVVKNEKKGGFGILLARKLMDGFDYRREDNQNILTMYKKVKEIDASKSV